MTVSGNRFLTLAEMKINATYIYEYLTANGWTKNAICGVLGNMQSESTINPAIWQGLVVNNTDGGYGLVQWTPATKYINWCSEKDLSYPDMDSNLKRILYEVQNHTQWYHPTMSFTEFTQSTDTAYNLALLFLAHYERPKNPNQPIRGTRAEYWFNYLDNVNPPPDPEQVHCHNSKTITQAQYDALNSIQKSYYKKCPVCNKYYYIRNKVFLYLIKRR